MIAPVPRGASLTCGGDEGMVKLGTAFLTTPTGFPDHTAEFDPPHETRVIHLGCPVSKPFVLSPLPDTSPHVNVMDQSPYSSDKSR